jgi:rhodanese-related sulfurtransferase
MRYVLLTVLIVSAGLVAGPGCDDGGDADAGDADAGDADADADGDVAADGDADADADADADGDADGDADADADGLADSDPDVADASSCIAGGTPELGTVTAEELHAELESKDFLLINVASAPSIPQTDAIIGFSDTTALMDFIGPDRSTPVVVYCQSGNRSLVAGGALVAEGYCAIRNLAGGKNAWVAAGYELDP